MGSADRAQEYAQEALDLRTDVSRTHPGEWVQRDLATSYATLGRLKLAKKDNAGAAALFEKAVTAREEVLKAVPTSPARQRNVIVARAELGDHLLKTGDATGAREQYERLVAVSRDFRLGDDSPVGFTN